MELGTKEEGMKDGGNPFAMVQSKRLAMESQEITDPNDEEDGQVQHFVEAALRKQNKGRRGTAKDKANDQILPEIHENKSKSLWPGQTMSGFYAGVSQDSGRDRRRSSTKVHGFGIVEGFDFSKGELPSDAQLEDLMKGKNASQRKALLKEVARVRE